MHTLLRRAIATLTIAVGLALPLMPSPAAAQEGNKDNVAVAINTKDGSSLFRFAFQIARVTSETVDSANAAVAFASCTECQTVAIAIQFVIVVGSPDVFTPTNLAIAVNQECSMCDTLASAYQFVIQTSDLVRLSPDGRRQIVELVHEVRALADSGLSGPEIQEKLEDIAHRMYDVMQTELVPIPQANVDHPAGQPTTTVISGTTASTAPLATTTTTLGSTGSTTTTARPTTTTSPTSTTTSSSTSTPTTTTTAAP